MTGKPSVCLALALTFAAAPAVAGTVYVPILSENGSDDTTYITRVWLTNQGNGPQTVETLLLANETNGTKRDGKKLSKTNIPAGGTVVLEVEGGPGLLEITAPGSSAGDLAISAEVRNPDQKGAQETHSVVPVISSDSAAAAGQTMTLQGLRRTEGGVFTNLALVNLGHQGAQCSVKAFEANGHQIASTALLNLAALSQAQFPDALKLLGKTQVKDVNMRIVCDQAFFAFLALYENEGGEVLAIQPSETGDSGLARPGDDGPSVPGAIVFSRNGTFHTPTPAVPTAIFNIPVPNDQAFSRVTVDLDIFVAGWSHDPTKNHSLFWLHRGACCWPQWTANVFGLINAFGPGKSEVKVVTNADLPRFEVRHASSRYALLQGHTYHLSYVYDVGSGLLALTVTDGGQEVARVQSGTTAKTIRSDNSNAFMIYFGHEDATGIANDRPTYGWKYSNLRVEFVP